MANDVQILDGFRYEFEPCTLWNSERGEGTECVILKLIDEARGFEVHAYYSKPAWDEFVATVSRGTLVASADLLRRVGV